MNKINTLIHAMSALIQWFQCLQIYIQVCRGVVLPQQRIADIICHCLSIMVSYYTDTHNSPLLARPSGGSLNNLISFFIYFSEFSWREEAIYVCVCAYVISKTFERNVRFWLNLEHIWRVVFMTLSSKNRTNQIK